MNLFFQFIAVIGASIVMVNVICSINRMSAATDHMLRLSYILISAGSFGELAAVFGGHVPGIAEVLFVGGFGLLDQFERRTPRHHEDSK
jgi:hypothetical protein